MRLQVSGDGVAPALRRFPAFSIHREEIPGFIGGQRCRPDCYGNRTHASGMARSQSQRMGPTATLPVDVNPGDAELIEKFSEVICHGGEPAAGEGGRAAESGTVDGYDP
ncbi:MAG TPA: hypothetical protein VG266_00975 [Candidatus Dormibacteraeota bacterium]|nr:hypothetical protein [Candidatus Dormibacteraeota bacterium]